MMMTAAACGSTTPSATTPNEKTATPIKWQPFAPAAFEQAKRENKLVMVDVGIEGCTACNNMHTGTYQNAGVTERVQKFVAVAVDADVRPDLGERWEPWGWPATIFLNANGDQVLAVAGSEPPADFEKILDDVLAKKAAGTLRADKTATIAMNLKGDHPQQQLALMCVEARRKLTLMEGDSGWGRLRAPILPPLEWAMMRGHDRHEIPLEKRALAMANGEEKILDPIWGGVFVAAHESDWSGIIPEKRTVHEAAALSTFAFAFGRTHDFRYTRDASNVRKYLEGWMLAPDGTFYSTQKDRAPGLVNGMTATQYYALGDADRRKYGIPAIDHGIYTDQNGDVIAAYAELYEATGDASALAVAVRAADQLIKDRQQPAGWMLQSKANDAEKQDDRLRDDGGGDRNYLKAQASFGFALLMLFEASNDARYLDAAQNIAKAMRADLEDKERAGFFATTPDETDALVVRRKPLLENATAARFLLRLAHVTHDDDMKQSAERALTATINAQTLGAEGPWGVGAVLLPLEDVLVGAVEISIVREKDGPESEALRLAALAAYEPRKVVHVEAPGHYPKPANAPAAAYVCTSSACSSPVTTVAALNDAIAKMGILQGDPPCSL